jgi:hypothetical protein
MTAYHKGGPDFISFEIQKRRNSTEADSQSFSAVSHADHHVTIALYSLQICHGSNEAAYYHSFMTDSTLGL